MSLVCIVTLLRAVVARHQTSTLPCPLEHVMHPSSYTVRTHRFCGIRCLTRDILSSTLSVSPPPVVASVDNHLRQPRSCEAADPHLASPAPTAVTAPECIRETLISTASFLCAMAVIFSGQPAILGANRRAEMQSIFNCVWRPSACTPCGQFPLVRAPTMSSAFDVFCTNQGRNTSIPLAFKASEVV